LRVVRPHPRDVRSACHLILVSGPPCSGKSTHVQEHKQPGDLVIDYDAIALALGSGHSHDHPAELTPFVHCMVDALLARLARQVRQRAWLIRCEPTAWDLAAARERVVMATDMDECLRRAADAGRPERWADMIRAHFKDG
jgi:hypothetical protein